MTSLYDDEFIDDADDIGGDDEITSSSSSSDTGNSDDRRRLLQWSPRCLSASLLQSSKAIDTALLKDLIKDDELVYCSSQDASIAKKDIPSNCFDEMYHVDLSAVIGVSHFFLVGSKAEDSNENENCPASIAMDQFNWQKKIAMIVEEDTKDLPKHRLGLASLGDILEAEEKVEAIPKEEYDYLSNGCAHYAQRIWRHLVFEETDALANFFVENVVEDSRAVEHAQKSKRGLRALASLVVGGKGGFKDYVKGIVYDQLEVVV